MLCLTKTILNSRVVSVLCALSFLCVRPAHAAIELVNVESNTASFFKGIGSNKKSGDSATIYGGTAGSTQCTGDGSQVCNNCDEENTSTSLACNEKQVYSSLVLQIRFKSDQKAGVTAIADESGNIISGLDIEESQNLAAGTEHVAKVQWGDICNGLLDIATSCEDDATGTLTIGVNGNGDSDLNDSEDDKTSVGIVVQKNITTQARACDDSSLGVNDGLCGFSVFPGDEKVFIQDLSVPDGFPSGAGGASHTKIRFYGVTATLSDGDSGSTTFSSVTHADKLGEFDIEKEDDGDLVTSSNSVNGLTNGQEYFFVAATVDEAQNVGFNTPVTRLDNSTQFLVRGTHSATPSPVSGLLSEDLKCFIATAAFGSPYEKHVVTLRQFRDRFLKTNFFGRLFVKAYYHLSPPLARFIAGHEGLRKAVRVSLIPVVFAASLSLNWSWLESASLLFLLIAMFTTGYALRRRARA